MYRLEAEKFKDAQGSFDFEKAWREVVKPAWDSLPQNIRDLVVLTSRVAASIHQDANLDLPWPTEAEELKATGECVNLRARFEKIPAEILKEAAEIVHDYGHFMPSYAKREDGAAPTSHVARAEAEINALIASIGGHWKFQRYADQSLRERDHRPWKGREEREPSEFERACAEIGLTCSARYLGEKDAQDRWTVALKQDGRTIETPYSAGFGHRVKIAAKANPPAVVRETMAERHALDNRDQTTPLAVRYVDTNATKSADWKPKTRYEGDYNPRHGRPVAPSAASVLSCLLLDAESVEHADGFEDWAESLGYDTDSRTAEKTYRECLETGRKLRAFLGDHYRDLARKARDL